jgi:hypothetical protein
VTEICAMSSSKYEITNQRAASKTGHKAGFLTRPLLHYIVIRHTFACLPAQHRYPSLWFYNFKCTAIIKHVPYLHVPIPLTQTNGNIEQVKRNIEVNYSQQNHTHFRFVASYNFIPIVMKWGNFPFLYLPWCLRIPSDTQVQGFKLHTSFCSS